MSTIRRTSALLLAAAALLVLCGCLPTLHGGSTELDSCSIAVYDATGTGDADGIGTQLDQVGELTGVSFHWVASSRSAKYGLTIAPIPAGTASEIQGSFQETYHRTGSNGEHVVVGAILRLRPTASAAIRRHELGHLFDLAHNPRSALMQEAPPATATYSAAERSAMRAMAVRSGC